MGDSLQFWNMLVTGISTFLNMMTVFRLGEISVFGVCIFALVLSLVWRYFLSPIFGAGGGSLNVSVSDTVKRFNKQEKNNDKKR